ncbi:hypothetical protein V6259_12790 [Marinomonas sp. TI.3.20]|uniref:hypothetical protein n=1 Tax=Marinomonas sp. TI.3.20 TaxID=3121296 RepID=UPI00311F62FF
MSNNGKYIKVRDLLGDPILGPIFKSNHLAESKCLSYITITTLRLILNYMDNHAGGIRPTYSAVSKMAKEKGVSDNLSSATIKQCFMYLDVHKNVKESPVKTSILEHAVKRFIEPCILVDDNGDHTDYEKLKYRITMVLMPLLALEYQHNTTPSISEQIVPLSQTMNQTTFGIAELVSLMLFDEDADFEKTTMQLIAQKKIGRSLSYQSISKIKNAVEWMRSNYQCEVFDFSRIADLSSSMAPIFKAMFVKGVCCKESLNALIITTFRSILVSSKVMNNRVVRYI